MSCELAQRSRIRAFRARQYVLIIAEGETPTPGFDVRIEQSPLKIFPPQFNVLQCPRSGIFPQVITPYLVAEAVRYPEDQATVTVHHADGADQVKIEPCGKELASFMRAVGYDAARPCPPGADEATGFSKKLSFDEAFANARANLPPFKTDVADALETIEVVEIGALFGGIAGFHDLFVRICRTHD
ncbi:MAG: hypothetical protein ACRDRX_21845 [Pseudonocardiaceae bacterium]